MPPAPRAWLLAALLLVPAGRGLAEPFLPAAGQRRNWIALPALGYSSDTGWMGGGLVMRLYGCGDEAAGEPPAVDCRRSQVQLALLYSQKRQLVLGLGGDMDWGAGRHHLVWGLGWRRFPSTFYGLGREASLSEAYTPRSLDFEASYLRRLGGGWECGLAAAVGHQRLETESLAPGGWLERGTLTGSLPFTRVGLGPRLLLDRRDQPWQPTRGVYLNIGATLFRRALGGDQDGERFGLDLRSYRGLGAGFVVAGQLAWDQIRGETPFDELPALGGDEVLRGYPSRRFRDRSRLFAQCELRRAQLLGRFGAVLFAGAGDVAPTTRRLMLGRARLAGGGGLRYELDPESGLALRFDYGAGEDGETGIAVSIGEAF